MKIDRRQFIAGSIAVSVAVTTPIVAAPVISCTEFDWSMIYLPVAAAHPRMRQSVFDNAEEQFGPDYRARFEDRVHLLARQRNFRIIDDPIEWARVNGR